MSAPADAADANFATHASWIAARLESMHVDARPDLTLVDSGLPCDTFNLVCVTRLDEETADARIREAVNRFRGVARPFSWWVGPADRPSDLGRRLVAAGLHPAESELAMAADLAALPAEVPRPAGLEVKRVRTPEALREFARISAANWTPPDPFVLRFYELAAPALLADDCPQWLYLGELDGVPVATAEATRTRDAAGLYNISTLTAFRRRGIGTVMTAAPLLDARADGIPLGVLQAASDGVGVYRRLGFRAYGTFTEFKPPA